MLFLSMPFLISVEMSPLFTQLCISGMDQALSMLGPAECSENGRRYSLHPKQRNGKEKKLCHDK